jgi:hypothetical protein
MRVRQPAIPDAAAGIITRGYWIHRPRICCVRVGSDGVFADADLAGDQHRGEPRQKESDSPCAPAYVSVMCATIVW